MNHSNTKRSTHWTTWWRPLALFVGVLALIGSTHAQISYTQDFTGCVATPCNDWTIAGGYSANITSATGEGYSPCGVGNPAAKSNIYSGATVTALSHATSLGTSTGAQATLTFDYKCIEYGTGAATPAGLGTIQPQWSVDGATWNVITTFASVSSATCVNTGTLNYVPTTGQPVFIRILAQSAGDFWFVVDNITYNQPINPACTGAPTPGNTLSSVASACAGEDFTLSLQNLTPGNNVGYQWYDGAGMIVGANSSTLVTNQSTATDYYCEVTCDASTVASATLNVPMTTLTLPEDMEAGFYPPGCWSETEAAPGDNYMIGVSGYSAYEVGSFSFLFDFFNAPGGTEFILTSPILPPTPAGYQVAFDVAGASYSGAEIDEIHLEESLDGGATWNLLQTMTNEDGVGVLSTKPADNTGLLPVAADWVSLAYPINAGADRIRFRAVSDFGNRVFMDNINVEELPSCDTPTGVDHVLNSQTEAVISWTLTSADTYNVEIRSSGLPGTGGEDAALTLQAGPTSDPITLAADQNYFAYVQGVCSGIPGDWSNAHPFRTGYCLAGATALTDEKIINVSVANINNPSPGIQVGYEDYTAITADMAPGVSYPFTIVPSPVYAEDRLLIWVDWNNDFDFDDVGENVHSSPGAANPFLGSITVPAAQPAGQYRMRIRLHDSTLGPNSTPCGNSTYGQVEDYTISVCSAPEASISVIDLCASDIFQTDLVIASFGSEASGNISYSINGGTPSVVPGAVGPNAGPAVPVGGYVNVVVDNGTQCLLDLGAWYSNCPDTVICSAPPESNTYCYKNGDTRTFHYQVEVGETVTLNFSAGSLDLNDAVNFYSGSSNLGTAINGGNFSGSLAGQNITSSGNELYFEIITVGSNSCFDGGQSTPWAWTVGCTPDCVPADGAVSYLSPAYTCDPNEFSLEFLLIDLGYEDGIGTAATSATLEWTVDGGSPGSQALTLADLFTPFNFGPFPLGSDVNVVIAHSTNSDCDKNLGIFTQADVCPPLNDECTSAETLNIVSVDGCPAGNITGTTAFATSSVGGTIPPPSCNVGTGNLQDVWYTFNTASFQSPLLMNFSAGTALSYGVELFDAGDAPDCLGALIGCLPNSPAGINFTGFGTNEQYYLRVFTYDGTGTAGTFNLCLAASSCPTPTGIASSGITDNQATITWTGPFSNYIIEYGPTVSFNTPGTGATPGPGGTIITAFQSPLTISGLTASTQYTFYMRRDCGSPDGFSLNSGGLIFTTQAPPPPSFPYITEVPFCGDQGQGPIPDNGCGTNTSQILDLFFPMPPGTTLGTDVVVESVDLVITHTYRGDLNISLISPSGQVRNLIVANGGDGFADYGDVVSCIPLKLKDGAPATIPAANAPTGTYAPAQPLSTMTGPVGTGSGDWRLRICDLFGGDIGTVQYVGLNFAPCVGPNFSTNVTTNCGALEYSVDVTINLMGSAASYDITNSLNGSIVTAGSTGTYTVGPFPAGTPVDLTLNHDANAVCTATALGLVGLCPPDNDLCGDAIMISCNSVTSGTTSGATAEAPAPAFCGTGLTSPGVWYTVAGFDGDMEVTTCGSSSPYDTRLNVYTGSCGSWTCVGGNDDSSPDCGFFLSRFAWTGSSAETYYILVQGFNGETGDFDLTVTCGDLNPACTENGLNLEFQNATNPGGVTWVIEDETGSVVVVSGTNVFPADAVGTQAICLPDGCYRLSVTDPAGDGITGYELRETGMNGRRIIDNTGNSITGTSAIANGGTFCLPIGNTSLIYSNCDKMDWVNYQYLVCHEEPLVSAEWQVGNQNNDGYNFWIFDPNGSYSFRRFHTHAVSDGFSPASATRAARIKINGWNNSPLTPHIPTGVMLNVRVRGVYNWNFTEWGPTCTMMIDPVAASCPMIWLQDDPANPSDYSCGVTRNFGGPNGGANKLTAKPPQFQPAPLAGGTGVRYQFRFRIPAEGVCIVRPPQTSPTLYLNWSAASGPQLEASKTYEVEVRASNDQGATWCVDSPSPACDPNPVTNWGRTCDVTISGVVNMDEETSSIAVQGDGGLTMYPNPNRGDQLFVSITELAPEVTTVSVDIYDLTGKRVIARTIAVQDGYLNTTMDLNGDLAGGMYMVNITAGDKAFTERLVIQP